MTKSMSKLQITFCSVRKSVIARRGAGGVRGGGGGGEEISIMVYKSAVLCNNNSQYANRGSRCKSTSMRKSICHEEVYIALLHPALHS